MPRSFFPVYLLVVLAAAAALQHLFVENKKVQEVTAAATKRLSALF